MRYLITLSTLFVGLQFTLGQCTLPMSPASILNTSNDCANPVQICQLPASYGFCSASVTNCEQNMVVWNELNLTAGDVKYFIFDHTNVGFSIELYGPYTDGVTACTDIQNNSPAPILSGTSNNNNPSYHLFALNFTSNGGYYYLKLIDNDCEGDFEFAQNDKLPSTADLCPVEVDECESCVGSFALQQDSSYVLTAWASQDVMDPTLTNFDDPEIYIDFYDVNGTLINTALAFKPSGQIIDNWQRIEEEFVVPSNAFSMKIRLSTSGGDVYYDDIRIFPFNASMKSYVYDPVFMRLAAELDERHFATYYEYDEEGKLVRIKKETEKGIMTIQETRNNNSKP